MRQLKRVNVGREFNNMSLCIYWAVNGGEGRHAHIVSSCYCEN